MVNACSLTKLLGLALLLNLTVACGQDPVEKSAHAAHVHHAPNGGTLIEVGAHQANLEIVTDRALGVLTIYVLGPHAERPVRLAREQLAVEITIDGAKLEMVAAAQANALSQESLGDSSTFVITDARLQTQGTLHLRVPSIKIYGQEFSDIESALP